MSFPKYRPLCLALLPATLHPAECDISLEAGKAQAEWLVILPHPLKREYLLQSTTPATGDRERKKLIQEGKLDQTFNVSY
uniref:NADH dehydrogenase [ubiquinone] 1 beta subcomplex subunit 4 n=1 Tax=Ailuropoda melanoleuca TaxID=9646 RepID=A0A7N5KK30_AILME